MLFGFSELFPATVCLAGMKERVSFVPFFYGELAVIRPATVGDAEKISRLICDTTIACHKELLGPGGLECVLQSLGPAATRKRLQEGWPAFCATVDAPADGEMLVGVILIKPPLHLFNLYVDLGYQQQGIGRQLFQRADQTVLETSGTPLQTVNSSINAIVVYERWGFQVEGGLRDKNGVRYQPMVREKRALRKSTPTDI